MVLSMPAAVRWHYTVLRTVDTIVFYICLEKRNCDLNITAFAALNPTLIPCEVGLLEKFEVVCGCLRSLRAFPFLYIVVQSLRRIAMCGSITNPDIMCFGSKNMYTIDSRAP